MEKYIEAIFIPELNSWYKVGGYSPYDGVIERIRLYQPDPRDYNGADTVFITLEHYEGHELVIKCTEYIVNYMYKENDN